MATRSTISIKDSLGFISTIYCHWDGYPEHNGEILKNHYKDNSKVHELINLGDISFLQPNVSPEENVHHDFENPADDVTIAYSRDRGEKYNHARVSTNFQEWLEQPGQDYDYIYIFIDRKWYIKIGDYDIQEL